MALVPIAANTGRIVPYAANAGHIIRSGTNFVDTVGRLRTAWELAKLGGQRVGDANTWIRDQISRYEPAGRRYTQHELYKLATRAPKRARESDYHLRTYTRPSTAPKKQFMARFHKPSRRHWRRLGRQLTRAKRKFTRKKKRARKAKINRPMRLTRQRGHLPFQDRMLVALPFTFNDIITTAANALVVTSEYRSSMFAPDATEVGHQPYQYDQVKSMYKKYQIYGIKFEITFSDPSADGMYCGVHAYSDKHTDQKASGSRIEQLQERGLMRMVPINNTGSQRRTWRGFVVCSKVHAISTAEFNQDHDTYGALVGANPSQMVNIECCTCSNRSTIQSIMVTGKLTFYGQLFEHILPAES